MERLLYTKKETGNVLGISTRAVDYLITQNAIRPVRFGTKVLVKKVDVEKLALRGFNGKMSQKSKQE